MTEPANSSGLACVEGDLLDRAQNGDRRAFDRLFAEHIPMLRGVVYRMVGHPEDVDDLVQKSLLQAYEKLAGFRGDSKLSTWLCSIGARKSIDHLRQKKRWRDEAQSILAYHALEDDETKTEIGGAFMDPGFTYDAHEHVAYCFTCVGRTLEPELQAALVLRDVLELSNDEAARSLEMSVSTFRHRLASARSEMKEKFEGLCALVNKNGVCWQCKGLRDAVPDDKKGIDVPTQLNWEGRLELVRSSPVGAGRSAPMHQVFFRLTDRQEEARKGDKGMTTNCGAPE